MKNNKALKNIFYCGQHNLFVYLLLTIATIIVYIQVIDFGFISFDDGDYITENLYVQKGLTKKAIKWAFHFTGKEDKTYYHPLTWLSHMLDTQLYGLKPAGHHLTSLLIHLINSLLLFFLFKKMTKAHWRSVFIASMFALHPIALDSVVWIAERKNILSTFFGFLSMLLYTYYLLSPTLYRYISVFLCMLSGLMAKPILVVLPFIFLLMDIWPLGRFNFFFNSTNLNSKKFKKVMHLIYEKIPFLTLSLIWVILSSLSIRQMELNVTAETVPMDLRLANAVVSYVKYILKAVWPFNLAIYYPYPETMLPLWKIVGAALFLAFVSFFSLYKLKEKAWLSFGWFWYLGTLFPAIGLMQNGLWPEMADRWAYVPFIGIYIIIAWGLHDIFYRFQIKKKIIIAICFFFMIVLMAINWNQCRYWINDSTLFRHALKVTTSNIVAHDNLAFALKKQGKIAESLEHLNASLQINPKNDKALFALGNLYADQGRLAEAVDLYLKILRIIPNHSEVYNNLGNVMEKQGKISDSVANYKKAIQINPKNEIAYYNLGSILFKQNKIEKAIALYKKALFIKPDFAEAHNSIGVALEKTSNFIEAIEYYHNAIRIKSDFVDALNNLGSVLMKLNKNSEAITYFSKSLQINSKYPITHNNMGMALVALGDFKQAHKHYDEAIRLEPSFAEAHNNLGILLYREGEMKEAIDHLKKAHFEMPDNDKFLKNLDIVFSKVNNAVRTIKLNIKNDPKNPHLYYQLGNMYFIMGEDESAIAQYQKALSLQSNFAPAKNAMIIINKKRKM